MHLLKHDVSSSGAGGTFPVFYLPGVKDDEQKAQHLMTVFWVPNINQARFNQP